MATPVASQGHLEPPSKEGQKPFATGALWRGHAPHLTPPKVYQRHLLLLKDAATEEHTQPHTKVWRPWPPHRQPKRTAFSLGLNSTES